MAHNLGERQRWAWISAGLSVILAACLCGFSWPWVLAGTVLVSVYYIYMDRHMSTDGVAITLQVKFGKLGVVLAGVSLLWIIAVLAWAAGLADAAFPMVEGLPGLGWVLLALAAWGSSKGPAACARCCGVLCLILLVLYGVVLVFALPDVKLEYLQPTGQWEQGIWTAALCLTTGGVWYVPCRNGKKGQAWQMAILLPLFCTAIAAVTSGVLSPELAAEKDVPLYDLAQSISVFGVVERIEPLLSAAMTMGAFALLSSLACAGQALADQLRPWKWNGAIICLAAAALMLPVRELSVWILGAGGILLWIVLPLLCRTGK